MARKAPEGADCKTLRSYWSAGINKGRLPSHKDTRAQGLLIHIDACRRRRAQFVSGSWTAGCWGEGQSSFYVVNISLQGELWRPPNPWENFMRKQGRLWESVPSHYLYILYNCLLAISGILSQILVIIFAHVELEAIFMVWPGLG